MSPVEPYQINNAADIEGNGENDFLLQWMVGRHLCPFLKKNILFQN